MRTGIRPADWCAAVEDCRRLKGQSGRTAVCPELSTGTDVFVNISVDYVKY